MGIDLTKPTSLYNQIADDISSRISKDEIKEGDLIGSHQQLAKEYGVSLITVRKALSALINKGVLYSRVGKGTFVAKKSEQVNFKNEVTIGFVLRDLDSPFFSRILSSVAAEASKNNFNLLLADSDNQKDREESQIRHFLDIGVNGLIIASMSHQYKATQQIRKMQEDGFPYVMVSFVVDDDISFVGTDHEEGGFIAADHLIKLGYKRIGYINGEEGNLVGEARKKGFLKAIQQAGLQFNTNDEFRLRLRGESFDYDSGYEIGEQFARKNDRPEALFIYNDLSTLGFQKAIFDNQLSVPEDVGIVGFDDIKRGVTAPIPLTTVHQPTDEIGALSVEILLRRIQGESIAPRHILKPSLVVRSSCGAKLRASKEAGGL